MYRLTHPGRISFNDLVQRLELFEYRLSRNPLGLRTHGSCPKKITLIVYDFGVKYLIKYHALHLKAEMEDNYKVTKDWEGKLYTSIALKWDYDKGMVQLSMPSYVCAALNSFQHKKPK